MICSKCKKDKSPQEFTKRLNRPRGRISQCKMCMNEYYHLHKSYYADFGKKYRKNNKDKIYHQKLDYDTQTKLRIEEYLKNHPCIDCSNADVRVLEFDHVKGIKNFSPSNPARRSWNTILKEIEKCKVRCSNCHSIRHYEERKNEYQINCI